MKIERSRKENNNVKVVILDVETSPIIAYTWGPKWEAGLIDFIEQSKILSYSAKWLGGKQQTKCLKDYSGYKKGIIEDKKIVADIYKILDEADVVITQNGRDFDIRVINARFLENGLTPPSPYKVVDTKVEAKRYFRLPSYSLDDMGGYFGLGKKLKHEGFELWKKCIAGDVKAWNLMKKYNAQDVLLTENLYLKIRPFMKSHPNLSACSLIRICPKCGSQDAQDRGYSVLVSGKYHRASCNSCGGWYRYGRVVSRNRDATTSI